MENMSEAELRRWAIGKVLDSPCFETLPDTATVCRLAMELVDFVRTGQEPLPIVPRGTLLM
jgi:hypothetical protein